MNNTSFGSLDKQKSSSKKMIFSCAVLILAVVIGLLFSNLSNYQKNTTKNASSLLVQVPKSKKENRLADKDDLPVNPKMAVGKVSLKL